jgi:hypothetical protein
MTDELTTKMRRDCHYFTEELQKAMSLNILAQRRNILLVNFV